MLEFASTAYELFVFGHIILPFSICLFILMFIELPLYARHFIEYINICMYLVDYIRGYSHALCKVLLASRPILLL